VDGGRDGALRRPRPRFSGRPECGESGVGRGLVPSPAAPLGDGDSAARYPYPSVLPGEEYDMKTNWIKHFIYSAGGILLAAALIRFLIVACHHPALALPEPLLGIPLRYPQKFRC